MVSLKDIRTAFSGHHVLAWVAALCAGFAVLGVAYFFAAVSAGEILRPMYDPVTRTISELAIGHDGWLQVSAFVALGVSLLALPAGLWQRVRTSVSSRLGLVLLVVCGASSFVAAAFPTDLRGAVVATIHGDVHEIAASVGYACLITAMLLFSWHFRRDHAWRPFHPTSTVLTLIGLATLLAMAATGNSEVVGLLQRAMAASLLMWVALTAVHAGRLSLAMRPSRAAPRD
jgi:Protein of unknown function (DUF998)